MHRAMRWLMLAFATSEAIDSARSTPAWWWSVPVWQRDCLPEALPSLFWRGDRLVSRV